MEHKHLDPYARLAPTQFQSELSAKSVIITGGGYGIGAAIAQSFVEAGVAQIVLVGRTESKLKATEERLNVIKHANTTISHHVADITSKKEVNQLFNTLPRAPDILVNNAGWLATPANFIDADLDEYWQSFSTNVYGTALFTQTFLRHRNAMGASTAPAVIITLNTIGAYSVRVPGLSSYGASKAALARWSELVSVDVPETVARFISVHPGAVKTDMGTKSGLEGAFPSTDAKLAGDFVVFAATEKAKFLAGRFAWVNWDVDELVAKQEEIIGKDLLRTSLS